MNDQFLKQDRFYFYDGAMGTMLQRHGLKQGEAPDLMCVTHPEVVEQVHRAYREAGSDILCTNTFGANRRNLAGSGHTVQGVVGAAVRLAKRAADGAALVAVDLGPIGELLAPMGTLSFADAYEMFREMAVAGEAAGADLAALETMSDLAEMRAAILAVREHTSLPILATMTFERSGRTYLGTLPESFAMVAESLGVSALGVNCSEGPAALLPIVRRIAAVTSLPLIVKPNAGLPNHDTGAYDLTPEAFGAEMTAFAELGARIVGGCCGTDPAYIRAVRDAFQALKPKRRHPDEQPRACTASAVVPLNGDVLLGTSLLNDARDAFYEAVGAADFDAVLELVNGELDDGADLVCLPVDCETPALQDAYLRILRELQGYVSCPLVFVGGRPDCLASVLRAFQGKACVMADNDADWDALTDVILKYGAILMGYQDQALENHMD